MEGLLSTGPTPSSFKKQHKIPLQSKNKLQESKTMIAKAATFTKIDVTREHGEKTPV